MVLQRVLVIGVAAGLFLPAVAPAELGPHSTWWAVHKTPRPQQDNVNIVYQRTTGRTDVNGLNRCLGTYTPQGSTTAYPASFDAYPIHVKRGVIAYHGKVSVYTGAQPTAGTITIRATLKPRKAVGTLKFAGTSCGTIHFVARFAGRTK